VVSEGPEVVVDAESDPLPARPGRAGRSRRRAGPDARRAAGRGPGDHPRGGPRLAPGLALPLPGRRPPGPQRGGRRVPGDPPVHLGGGGRATRLPPPGGPRPAHQDRLRGDLAAPRRQPRRRPPARRGSGGPGPRGGRRLRPGADDPPRHRRRRALAVHPRHRREDRRLVRRAGGPLAPGDPAGAAAPARAPGPPVVAVGRAPVLRGPRLAARPRARLRLPPRRRAPGLPHPDHLGRPAPRAHPASRPPCSSPSPSRTSRCRSSPCTGRPRSSPT
jgi:hypothetical protein